VTTHPPWFDPAPPNAEVCVLRTVLARHAAEDGDRPCVRFGDESWSYVEAVAIARRAAGGLAALGVKPGDRVLIWLPNSLAFMRAWLGAAWLGAVPVPMNPAFRGHLLQHAIALSGAAVLVAHAGLVPRLGEIVTGPLEAIVAFGGAPAPIAGLRVLDKSALDGAPIDAARLAPLARDDIALILFTSGTTGPSKGVLCPYAQMHVAGMASYGYLRAEDRVFLYLPLFHTLGLSCAFAAFARGACLVLAESFNARTFWDDLARSGCNRIVGFISSLTAYLAKAGPPAHKPGVDFAMVSPISRDTTAFAERLGLSWYDAYGMTETSSPLVTDIDSRAYGSCGRPRAGIECRIVDSEDRDMAEGAVGELILRSGDRAALNAGYIANDAATAEAWRGGWFHTGDAFRRDAAGNYYFVDRLKDAIRRRGENISSFEVEHEIAAFPGVAACAAVAVRGGYGDDEVLAVVAGAPGVAIDPAALIGFLAARLPHFMVPRYVRVLPELPRTATNKVQKTALRAEGVTPDTWDREAAGIAIKREALEKLR